MLKKKKKAPVEDMSFTIDPSDRPIKKKKPVVEEPEILEVRKKKKVVTKPVKPVKPVAKKTKRIRDPDQEDYESDLATMGIKDEDDEPPASKKKVSTAKKKKRRIDGFYDKLEKKPKRSTDIVTYEPATPQISKLNKGNLVSIIADDAEQMQRMFEDENTDQAIRMLNRRLIQTCIDLIPQLENSMRESNGRYGAHALNGTIQTIRELVIDLQRMQDRGAIGEAIIERIIRPSILELATKIVEESATVLSEVKDSMPEDGYNKLRQAQIDSRNRLASMMNQKYEFIREETIQFLQR
jgi:hypothetical protein